MKAVCGVLSALAFALLLRAQSDLPKNVIQLAQLKRDVAASLAVLNNYTCVETIQRSQRKSAREEFRRFDTLHVEVAVVNNNELFSWPGAHEFEDRNVGEMVGSGMMSTGSFRSAIQSVLLDNVSTIRWHGEEVIRGHRALRWDYNIPYNLSRWDLQIYGHTGRVSEAGSFWADAETLKLMRLETTANDIPPELQVLSVMNEIDYAPMQVRSQDLLLPQSVELLVTNLKGFESRNRIEFSQCREFAGSAKLGFDQAAPSGNAPAPAIELDVPANLEFPVHLDQAIDSKTAAVGDRITAIIDADVRVHGAVLIPIGSMLLGRIRRLDRETEPRPYYLLGLEFTQIEFAGRHARFTEQMLGAQPVAGLSSGIGIHREKSTAVSGIGRNALEAGSDITTYTEDEVPIQIPGVSTFFVEGRAFRIPEGWQMTWRTTRLAK